MARGLSELLRLSHCMCSAVKIRGELQQETFWFDRNTDGLYSSAHLRLYEYDVSDDFGLWGLVKTTSDAQPDLRSLSKVSGRFEIPFPLSQCPVSQHRYHCLDFVFSQNGRAKLTNTVTFRIRRVKCDEEKPYCRRCSKFASLHTGLSSSQAPYTVQRRLAASVMVTLFLAIRPKRTVQKNLWQLRW